MLDGIVEVKDGGGGEVRGDGVGGGVRARGLAWARGSCELQGPSEVVTTCCIRRRERAPICVT